MCLEVKMVGHEIAANVSTMESLENSWWMEGATREVEVLLMVCGCGN